MHIYTGYIQAVSYICTLGMPTVEMIQENTTRHGLYTQYYKCMEEQLVGVMGVNLVTVS